MISSITKATMRQYTTSLLLWTEYCSSQNIPIYEASYTEVIEFLKQRFDEGASYTMLNTIRSAISLISSKKIGDDPHISRFFRGLYKLRPPKPRYNFTWNPKQVLDYLRGLFPLDHLTLEQLSLKLVGLLALVTAHRVQTFASIKCPDIVSVDDGIQVFISSQIKTSRAGQKQPVLFLPYYADEVSLCAARTLLEYQARTEKIRKGDNLFISISKPHKSVSAQTISRWIKKVLELSGIDVGVFSGHSTRHAATSAAARLGVNLDTIRNTAGWTDNSATFARFYQRPLANREAFANSVLATAK